MNALQQKMIVRNDTDIVNARMAVREFARECGFGSRDQACISLVSASVVGSLGLGKETHSIGIEILMEYFESSQKHGVRVSCIKYHSKMSDREVTNRLKSSYLLVDDIQMKPAPHDGIEVIVTKWDSTYKG
jgi:hypothetical protein